MAAQKAHDLVFVGGFTTEKRKARGDGLHVYRRDRASNHWTHVFHLGGLTNPSFLTMDPQRDVLYAAHGDSDYATSYAIDTETGVLKPLGQAPTGGTNGVHPALSPDGRFLIVANYSSGSVSVLPVAEDGTLSGFIDRLELPGEVGPNRIEQTVAHPHQCVFDPSGRFIIVPDKGLDKVFVLGFDPKSGKLSLTDGDATFRPASGPRHMVFHPKLPIAFVVTEIESALALCRWDAAKGKLIPQQMLTSLPPDFFGASTAAAIVITSDGRQLFVSNRGHDSFARYVFDEASMRIEPAGWTMSEGRDPRFMCLDPTGRSLIVANEQSDTILSFEIPADTATEMRPGPAMKFASPATIAFA